MLTFIMKDSIKPSNDGNESDKAVKVIENKTSFVATSTSNHN